MGSHAESKDAPILQLLVDRIVLNTVEIGCVSIRVAINAHKELPDIALPMVEDVVVHSLVATREHETSFSVQLMEAGNGASSMGATNLQLAVRLYVQLMGVVVVVVWTDATSQLSHLLGSVSNTVVGKNVVTLVAKKLQEVVLNIAQRTAAV